MAITYRHVLNNVLELLSEDQIEDSATELTSDYHKLVAAFVNHFKDEVEQAHTWTASWRDVTVPILANTDSGTIEDSTMRHSVIRIQQSTQPELVALVFDVTDAAQPILLKEIDLAEMIYKRRGNPATSTAPVYFSTKIDDDGVQELIVYPKPNNTRSIIMTMNMPVAFNNTATIPLTTEILVPYRPIVIGAVWYALQERGEELGISSMFTEERYLRSLDDAVARDWAIQGGMDLVPM